MRIPELLAPVGSMDHLKVAINAGASSVYLSGKNYGARKFAKNFTLDEIYDIINLDKDILKLMEAMDAFGGECMLYLI